jgi:hypothetical protein
VVKGIVNRTYSEGGKDFGFILRGEEEYYFDPRLVAAEEPPLRGDTVFFTAEAPLKTGGKPVAGCILVKDKAAIGVVINILPNGGSCFLQVADELGHRYNVHMSISKPMGDVQIGDRFLFYPDENRRGVYASRAKRPR